MPSAHSDRFPVGARIVHDVHGDGTVIERTKRAMGSDKEGREVLYVEFFHPHPTWDQLLAGSARAPAAPMTYAVPLAAADADPRWRPFEPPSAQAVTRVLTGSEGYTARAPARSAAAERERLDAVSAADPLAVAAAVGQHADWLLEATLAGAGDLVPLARVARLSTLAAAAGVDLYSAHLAPLDAPALSARAQRLCAVLARLGAEGQDPQSLRSSALHVLAAIELRLTALHAESLLHAVGAARARLAHLHDGER